MTGDNRAIPVGALVLIIGINGYIGAHAGDQLLQRGYRVRGTARSAEKLDAVLKTLKARNPGAEVDGVVVEDMQSKDAFVQVVRGVAGIIHFASDLSLSPDPNKVIAATIGGVKNILDAAMATPTVKRVVFTSSSITLPQIKTGNPGHFSSSDWNLDCIPQAWAPPPYEPTRAFPVYAASKVEAEQFAWKYMEEKKPQFVLNICLPALVCGPVLEGSNRSSAAWFEGVHAGDEWATDLVRGILSISNWHINVEDMALLHIAGLLEEDVKGERIMGMGERCTWRDIIETLKEIDPSKTDYPEPVNKDEKNILEVDISRTVDLLKKYGRAGPTSLHKTFAKQFA